MRRFIAASAVLVASMALAAAQQQPQTPAKPASPSPEKKEAAPAQPPAGGRGAAGPEAKPVVPVAASTFANHPDPYVGMYVSLTGAVEQTLSKSTFSVDQGKKTEKDILIIAPTLTGTVEPSAYVTVLGDVIKFDAAELKKKSPNYALDLPADAMAKYQGHPVIIAKAVVVNSTGVDIAKVLPPPMTAEEEAFQKVMRQVGPANTALRAAIEKMDAAAVKEQAAILSKSFTQTEAFWKTKGKADAVGFASTAKKHADEITTAANAAKWDDVKAAATPLGAQCGSCHGAYRERLDDGSFRIKAGSR